MNRYEITWFTQGEQIINTELKEKLEMSCTTLRKKMNVAFIKCETQSATFSIESQLQLNLNKVLKGIEKVLPSTFMIDDKKTLILSVPDCIAYEDKRLTKLIEDIEEVGYYDLHEYFSGDLKAFKAYLKARRLALIEQGERFFLIDLVGLNQKINLNCMACTRKYQYGCCCGSPCNMGSKNHERFLHYELDMAKEVAKINPKAHKEIQEMGGFIDLDGTIHAYNGHCSLLVKDGESYKCLPHKYALDKEIPIYDICPLSCLMYPFEILRLFTHKKRQLLFLTSVVEESFAEHYGRWGSYKSLAVDLKCIHIEEHDEIFELNDYKPVYQVNKGLICHEFGRLIYKCVNDVCEEASK